jgi:hypothetical protein
VRGQVSHLRRTDKVTVLIILISIFLESKREYKRFPELNDDENGDGDDDDDDNNNNNNNIQKIREHHTRKS